MSRREANLGFFGIGGEHSSKELFKNSLVMAIQNIYMTITSCQSKVGLTL